MDLEKPQFTQTVFLKSWADSTQLFSIVFLLPATVAAREQMLERRKGGEEGRKENKKIGGNGQKGRKGRRERRC